MKKSLLAVAVAAALPAVALAQSNVTMYGTADVRIENQNAAANGGTFSRTYVTNGHAQASRFGIRGSESLSGGMNAVFNIEHRYNLDEGTQNSANMWNGTSWVGLNGGFGEVRFGRQYTPTFWALIPADFLGYSYYNNWLPYFGAAFIRVNDQIQWRSPSMGGATVWASYAPGETAAKNHFMGVGGNYRVGNVVLAAGYQEFDNPAAGAIDNLAIAASYQTAAWAVSLGHSHVDNVGGTDVSTTLVSARASLAGGTLVGSLAMSDHSASADLNDWSITYIRPMSKRTIWYAGYGFNERATGADARSLSLGIRHQF